MIPRDLFIRFCNEVFKFPVAQDGPQAYYPENGSVSGVCLMGLDNPQSGTRERFRNGLAMP